MARRRYDIWVQSVDCDDGNYYHLNLTMEQCRECDKLCSGMIEQVDEDVILWHDIKSEEDVKTAFKWLHDNIYGIQSPNYVVDVSFTTYIVTSYSAPLTRERIYYPSWIDMCGLVHWDYPAEGGKIGDKCIDYEGY